MKALSILFGAGWTVATAWALGRVLLARVPLRLYREERPLFCFVLGAPLLSLLMFALGFARLWYDATFLVTGAAALAAAWRWGRTPEEPRLEALPPLWRRIWWLVFVPFAFLYAVNAMAPEMSPDGSTYHLGLVNHYYRQHGYVRVTTNMYANLSQGVDLLFLHAYAFGRHSAAALVHCSFLLALPWLLVRFGQRAGHAAAGVCAAVFVFCSPVAGVDGSSAYIDLAVAATLFTVFYLAEIWRAEKQSGLPLLIGFAAGACYGMKYTAFLAVPYALARVRRPLVAAAAAIPVLPWLVRNWLWYDNPFSPLLNAVFPNPYVHVFFEQEYARMMRHYEGLQSYWQLPLELTLKGQVLGGLTGPLFLLLPVALLALRSPLGRRVVLAAALFASVYFTNIGTRFLIPALPFLALGLALGLPALRYAGPTLALAHALASWPQVLSLYCAPYGWRISSIPLKQALRITPEDSWLGYKWPQYRTARMLKRLPEGSVIYSFSPVSEAYTRHKVWTGFQSATGETLRLGLLQALIEDWEPRIGWEFRFPRQALDGVRVVQTAGGAEDQWSVHELRVFDGKRELERSREWRVRAWPFPWDAPLAFDNAPATRWRSWQSIQPGMFIEADFRQPVSIDGVRLDCPTEPYAVRIRLEDRRGNVLVAEPREVRLPPNLELRRAATEELKRHGITHLLVHSFDFGAADFESRARLWGLRRIDAVDGHTLFAIQ